MYEADTIAAVATPSGAGGIGIVRVSGPLAATIADRVFRRHQLGLWETHRLYRGSVMGPDAVPIDDGLAVLMRGPHSYTGEDVLELHCHGSPAILRLAVSAALRHGARPAQPGEFTRRAFFNGKLDLTQAEAVLDLVRAQTPEAVQQAADQLFGGLGRHLEGLRQSLIRAKAHLEVRIDFAGDEFNLDDSSLGDELSAAREQIDRLLLTYARGRVVREGVRVAIVGRPNAGKSSLLNALLGEDRAIVTPFAGTTRDVIEETADCFGVPVVMSDTAGMRESPDPIERIGVERARATALRCDLSLLVVDASTLPEPPIVPITCETVVAFNKIDLPCAWSRRALHELLPGCEPIRVSATQRIGLDELQRAIVGRVAGVARDGIPPLVSERHRDALSKARDSVGAALDSTAAGIPPEIIAVDVQAALDHIGSVTGAVTSEEVLDSIFAEFCIGK
jgi:tRNA modification GTPase